MARSKEQWTFEGFSNPNFTTVPDEFFDMVAPRLSGSEVKVALYIIRRTYGFKKESDDISLSQMQNGITRRDGTRLDLGAGVSKPCLLDALKSLESKSIIQRTLQWDTSGDPSATNYRLNVRLVGVGKKTYLGSEGVGKKTYRGEAGKLTDPLVKKPTSQYTVNNIQLYNNVNGSKKNERSPLHKLDDEQHDKDHIKLIAADILEVLGDEHSMRFYLLVARKIPEQKIRAVLSELKQSTVRSKARLFTHNVMEFAESAVNYNLEQEHDAFKANELKKHRAKLAKHYKSH